MFELEKRTHSKNKNSLQATFNKTINTLFAIYYFSYKEYVKDSKSRSSSSRGILYFISIAYLSIQLLSLTLPTSMDNWSYFETPSYLLSLARIDFLASSLGMSVHLFIGVQVLLSLILIVWLYVFIQLWKDKEYYNQRVKYFLFSPLGLIGNLLFLPFLCSFLGIYKYSIFPESTAFNYNETDGDTVSIGLVCVATFPLFLVFLVFQLFEVIFKYDQFLTRAERQIQAKPYAKVEKTKFFVILIISVSHFFVHPVSHGVHLVFTSLLSLIMSWLYLYYMPFFNDKANFVNIACFYLCFLGSSSQLMGYLLGNGSIVIQFLLIFYPINLILVWSLIKTRKRYVMRNYKYTHKLTSKYQYEILIRMLTLSYLYYKEKKQTNMKKRCTIKIESLFKKLTSIHPKCKKVAIWKFVYFWSIVKDPGIASFKLAEASDSFVGMEESYHIYKLSREFNETSGLEIEENNYLNFQLMYKQSATLDIKTCNTQVEFWTELSKKNLRVDQLEKLGLKLSSLLTDTKTEIKKMVNIYQSNTKALLFYGSFLSEIANETEQGFEIQSKAENMRNKEVKFFGGKENYFSDDIGILIASAAEEFIGTIVSVNNQSCSILNLSQLDDQSIFSFLPYPFNKPQVKKQVYRALRNCTKTTIDLPDVSLILNSQGFLIEASIKASIVAVHNIPYIFMSIFSLEDSRELIYYDDTLTIRANSANAGFLLGFCDEGILLNDLALSTVVHNCEHYLDICGQNKTAKYRHKSKVYLKTGNVSAFGHTLNILYIDTSRNDNFIENLKETRMTRMDSPVDDRPRGILKRDKGVKNPDKKVQFKMNIDIREIEFTDFQPGKKVNKSVKDLDDKQSKEEIEEELDPETLIKTMNIIDLSSIEDPDFLKNSEKGESDFKNKANSKGSVASTTSSSTLLDAIDTQTTNSLSKNIFKFKFYLFVTIILVIIAILSMSVYITLSISRYQNDLIIDETAKVFKIVTDMSIESRNILNLSHRGELDSGVVEAFNARIDELKDIESKMNDKIIDTPYLREFMNEDSYLSWELQNSTISSRADNKKNLLEALIRESITFSALSEFKIDDPSFFYVFRNGMFDTAKAMNTTLQEVIDYERDYYNQVLSIILYIGVSVVATLILCLVLIIIPGLKFVEKSNRTVWKLFFYIPLEIITEIKGKCEDRLENTHQIEQFAENTASLFDNINSRAHFVPHKKFLRILAKIMVYYAMTLGFLSLYYFRAYLPIRNYIHSEPQLIDWTTETIVNVNLAYFWLEELKLVESEISYFRIVPEFQAASSPSLEITEALKGLKYFDGQLVNSQVGKMAQSKDALDQLLKEVKNQPAFLHKGIHSAILVYMDDIRYFANIIQTIELDEIKKQRDLLVDGLLSLREIYRNDVDVQLDEVVTIVFYAGLFYSISVFMIFICFYVPFLNSIKNEIESIWNISKLVPTENRKQLLLKMSKED